jgi:hypothetical protein
MLKALRLLFLGWLSLTTAAEPSAEAQSVPASAASRAIELCAKHHSDSVAGGEIAAPALLVTTSDQTKGWKVDRWVGAAEPAATPRSIFCVRTRTKKAGTYDDGSTGYSVERSVTALSWPDGKVAFVGPAQGDRRRRAGEAGNRALNRVVASFAPMTALHLARSLAVSAVFASSTSAGGVAIDHEGVGCVVADRFPRFEARLHPAENVARARLFFQPEGTSHWYWVPMKDEGAVFAGVLPKPQRQLEGFRYYIDVTDASLTSSRTEEFTPVVASGAAACADRGMAETLGSATVVVGAPRGAPQVPEGFGASGVTTAAAATNGTAGGAAVGAGAAAAAGAGIWATGLVVGGIAAAGAVTAGAVLAGKGNQPPAASILRIEPGGTALVAATEITFTASATDPDGDSLTYTWDFGDGASASGQSARHVYARDGSFDVVLTVRDGAHTVTDRRTIPARSLTGRWVGIGFNVIDFDLIQSGSSFSASGVGTGGAAGTMTSVVGAVANPRVITSSHSAGDFCPGSFTGSANDTITEISGTMSPTAPCTVGPYPYRFTRQ